MLFLLLSACSDYLANFYETTGTATALTNSPEPSNEEIAAVVEQAYRKAAQKHANLCAGINMRSGELQKQTAWDQVSDAPNGQKEITVLTSVAGYCK